jgi:hypothetical protein
MVKTIKRKFYEFFKIKKKGKTKTVKKQGEYDEKVTKKGQKKKQEKQLIWILSILGLFVLAMIIGWILINRPIKYEGVEFKKVEDNGGLILYNTKLPTYTKSGEFDGNYNFYLRNNPKKLEKIPFEGNFTFTNFLVMNATSELKCEGNGVIGIANIQNLYNFIDIKVLTDKNTTCDELGRYTYLNIKKGEETKIIQYGPSCYEVSVKDCEILKATERFMLEGFVKVNKIIE